MNFEILSKAIPEECMHAFLSKQTRYDNRKFTEEREFKYIENIFEAFSFSAIGTLGLNKIIVVLQEEIDATGVSTNVDSFLNVHIEHLEKNKSSNSVIKLYEFVNKLISENIELNDMKVDNKKYKLFISIESDDGNIYDTIAMTLLNVFKEGNKMNIHIKQQFKTKTFCVIEDIVLFDPLKEEANLTNYMFNVITFPNNKVYFHKIKGDFIRYNLMKDIINKTIN